MKLIIALCLVVVASAAPPPRSYNNYQQNYQNQAQLLRYDNENSGNGYYRFGYEQSDGQRREEIGELKNPGQQNEHLAVRGAYSWVAPDGVTYTVIYLADDNGFQPEVHQQPPGAPPPSAVYASILG